MNRIIISVLVFFAWTLFADSDRSPIPTAEFSGEGLVKARADFITLTLAVHSECQENPKSAQAATDDITKKIDDYFQTLKQEGDSHFKVLVDGGLSMPYSRYVRVGDRDREVCRNTFQKVTNITLKLAAREDFHRVFADIQDFVLKNFEQGPPVDDTENPRSYVSISTPTPELTRENRLAQERIALDQAVRNAKANFVAAIKSCEPHRWKVYSIKENGGSYQPPRPMRHYAMAKAAVAMGASAEAAPVRFDLIEVSKSVTVVFEFDGVLCYEK